ncbi:DUF2759 domain-containing protein [Planococcus lenghuensis]|uniref:DUF2759 domain-containing protein n=1 Tax=Planococcus lenghuensis TaxID=2213202 RepID=A0A1Q2KZD9_9BACL|nr:DUF2759 domain-containing protein [Planococcus lenghuensis]AQQ53002.1 DUF2759 domain-containing protein [Planococcus lenghuensis]
MNLLMVIFGLVAVFAAIGVVQTFKRKEFLGLIFNLLTFLIFGAFTAATVIFQGYPPSLH